MAKICGSTVTEKVVDERYSTHTTVSDYWRVTFIENIHLFWERFSSRNKKMFVIYERMLQNRMLHHVVADEGLTLDLKGKIFLLISEKNDNKWSRHIPFIN